MQSEYSLWSRNPETGLIKACREAGTALVAFSPLGRGFLAGAVNDPARLEENDMRRGMPRFSAENHAHNLRLLEAFTALAEERGMTPGQLALAWLRAQGDEILPIPGSRNIDHMPANLAAEHHPLAPHTVARLNAMITPDQVAGARYDEAQQAEVDTEEFGESGAKSPA